MKQFITKKGDLQPGFYIGEAQFSTCESFSINNKQCNTEYVEECEEIPYTECDTIYDRKCETKYERVKKTAYENVCYWPENAKRKDESCT